MLLAGHTVLLQEALQQVGHTALLQEALQQVGHTALLQEVILRRQLQAVLRHRLQTPVLPRKNDNK